MSKAYVRAFVWVSVSLAGCEPADPKSGTVPARQSAAVVNYGKADEGDVAGECWTDGLTVTRGGLFNLTIRLATENSGTVFPVTVRYCRDGVIFCEDHYQCTFFAKARTSISVFDYATANSRIIQPTVTEGAETNLFVDKRETPLDLGMYRVQVAVKMNGKELTLNGMTLRVYERWGGPR